MRILVVCQYYYPEPFRITDLCETLAKRGHKITVLTGLPNYPEGTIPDAYQKGKRRSEIRNGVKIERCFEIGRGTGSIRRLLNYISYAISGSLKASKIKEEFDVVLINQLSPILMAYPGIIYQKHHSVKIIHYCLDLWPVSLIAGGVNESSFIYRIFMRISKKIYHKADKILITSFMFKKYLIDVINCNPGKIEYLPQYAEDLFNRQPVSSRKRTDEAEDKYDFVMAGNVGDIQSVDTIIRAANELREHKNIMLHIYGDGSNLNACRQLAKVLKVSNIQFHGRRPVEEMPQIYESASAMIITLKDSEILSYTVPGKLQSYMAAGRPILGAINGEAMRIITDAQCGLCCAADDYKGLAQIILEFIRSDRKDQMALASRAYYRENFGKEQFFIKLENAIMNSGAKECLVGKRY